jgi:hypothetical protein
LPWFFYAQQRCNQTHMTSISPVLQAVRKALRAIHKLPKANGVVIKAVLFIKPR